MDEKEILKERFKAAISSAVKVISEQHNLEVKFGTSTNSKNETLNLPEILALKNLQDFINLRAFADSEALKIRYTDKKIYLKNEPKTPMAKSLYAIAEKIRYEKLGSNKLKGIKNNLIKCYENKFKNKKISEIKTEADVPITEAFELYLKNHFFNIKQTPSTKKVLSYWQELFDKNIKTKLKDLENNVENQEKFNHLIAEVIDDLKFEDSDSKEKEEKKETANEDTNSQNGDDEKNESSEQENEESDNSFNVTDDEINTLSESDNLNESKDEDSKENPTIQRKKQNNILK